MKVFLQSIFGQLILTPYIFWRTYQAVPARKSLRIPVIIFFVLELLLFFTGYFLYNFLPDRILVPILYICNTWYIASLYITMALLFLDFLRLTNRWWKWFPAIIKNNWARVKLICLFSISLGSVGLMFMAYRNVTHPVVHHVYLEIPKKESTRDSLTIAMMSDLHIGEVIGKKMVQKYVSLANAENPDMIVLVGDVLDYESRFAEMEQVEDDLQMLKAPLGTYIIYGNHEYRANRHAKTRWFEKTGATLLVDSVVMPDSTFYLIGRDDMVNRKRTSLVTLLQKVDEDKPIIVLDHQPWNINEMVMTRIDLGLHGHTHNGQLWPYPLLMKFIYEVPYGYYKKGVSQFFVSSGIGVAGPPYRVGTRSELIILHIRFVK